MPAGLVYDSPLMGVLNLDMLVFKMAEQIISCS